jgi:flagellin-specific chaperone FliS
MLQDDREINPYVQQEILSASQIRLRWMLISRAVELCSGVESLWKDGQHLLGDQWALRIREILGELLAGVSDGNPLSRSVADFYTFLLTHLTELEKNRDTTKLANLKSLLAFDGETWKMVLDKASSGEPTVPAPKGVASAFVYPESSSLESSFSLEI